MNDLLKVLDMSKEKQRQTVLSLLDEETIEWFVDYDMHLTDLAFRLRDEVLNENEDIDLWDEGINAVAQYVTKEEVWKVKKGVDVCNWLIYFAQPIHWIIAALIAKGKK